MNFRNTEQCEFCGRGFQYGLHAYHGKFLTHYRLSLCRTCYEGNWDGIAPLYEQKFERHLEAHKIPKPNRNAKDLYPR